jgi:hypothetical protein
MRFDLIGEFSSAYCHRPSTQRRFENEDYRVFRNELDAAQPLRKARHRGSRLPRILMLALVGIAVSGLFLGMWPV